MKGTLLLTVALGSLMGCGLADAFSLFTSPWALDVCSIDACSCEGEGCACDADAELCSCDDGERCTVSNGDSAFCDGEGCECDARACRCFEQSCLAGAGEEAPSLLECEGDGCACDSTACICEGDLDDCLCFDDDEEVDCFAAAD